MASALTIILIIALIVQSFLGGIVILVENG